MFFLTKVPPVFSFCQPVGASSLILGAQAPQNDTEPPEDLHQLSKETDRFDILRRDWIF